MFCPKRLTQQILVEHLLGASHLLDIGDRQANQTHMVPFMDLGVEKTKVSRQWDDSHICSPVLQLPLLIVAMRGKPGGMIRRDGVPDYL